MQHAGGNRIDYTTAIGKKDGLQLIEESAMSRSLANFTSRIRTGASTDEIAMRHAGGNISVPGAKLSSLGNRVSLERGLQ